MAFANTRRAAPVAVLVLVILLGGCSSSGATSPPRTGSAASPTGTSAADTAGSPAANAIKAAFTTFFSSTTSLADSQDALQHGAAFAKTLAAEANSPASANSSVIVTATKSISANLASVTFTVKSGGFTVPGLRGHAVRENGRWKVAAETFCMLLNLDGSAPGVCKNSTITALPR